MNSQLLRLRQAGIDLGIRQNSRAFISALWAINNEGEKSRTGKNQGRGRWAFSMEWTAETMRLLKKAGFECYSGNDAPRGGKAGEYVRVPF